MPILAFLIPFAFPLLLFVFVRMLLRWLRTRKRTAAVVILFTLAYAGGLFVAVIPGVLIRNPVVIGWAVIAIAPITLLPSSLPVYFALKPLGLPRISFIKFSGLLGSVSLALFVTAALYYAPAREVAVEGFSHWVFGNPRISFFHGVFLMIPATLFFMSAMRVAFQNNTPPLLRYRSGFFGMVYLLAALAEAAYFLIPVFEKPLFTIIGALLTVTFVLLSLVFLVLVLVFRVEENNG